MPRSGRPRNPYSRGPVPGFADLVPSRGMTLSAVIGKFLRGASLLVIPAKAGIHGGMDPGFRRDDKEGASENDRKKLSEPGHLIRSRFLDANFATLAWYRLHNAQ